MACLRRVGVLLRRDWSNAEHDWRVALAAARTLDLDLLALDARSADDLTAAFDLASANGVDGIMTFRSPTVVTYLTLIAELCGRHRLPAVFDAREYVEAGGLLSYGPNIDAIYRQLATYVGKLLRGAPVAELPIEEPTTFELVINKRTAATIGLTLPSSLLERADTVIE
jgi:putative ABC transport system substrate-binding protein